MLSINRWLYFLNENTNISSKIILDEAKIEMSVRYFALNHHPTHPRQFESPTRSVLPTESVPCNASRQPKYHVVAFMFLSRTYESDYMECYFRFRFVEFHLLRKVIEQRYVLQQGRFIASGHTNTKQTSARACTRTHTHARTHKIKALVHQTQFSQRISQLFSSGYRKQRLMYRHAPKNSIVATIQITSLKK